jgi:hypothetical protein
VTEREFQGAVCEALSLLGWRWCHFRPAHTQRGWRTALSGSPGFPDLVAVPADRVLFIELRSERGRSNEAQVEWLERLAAAGFEAAVWRLSDWPAIAEALQ